MFSWEQLCWLLSLLFSVVLRRRWTIRDIFLPQNEQKWSKHGGRVVFKFISFRISQGIFFFEISSSAFLLYTPLTCVLCLWMNLGLELACKMRLIQRVFSNANDIYFFFMIFHFLSLHCKLAPDHCREYDINLFLMIFSCMSLHCKLAPDHCREYDINLFLMIFSCMSLHCKLVSVAYRE